MPGCPPARMTERALLADELGETAGHPLEVQEKRS
jgi:hypothetical protein